MKRLERPDRRRTHAEPGGDLPHVDEKRAEPPEQRPAASLLCEEAGRTWSKNKLCDEGINLLGWVNKGLPSKYRRRRLIYRGTMKNEHQKALFLEKRRGDNVVVANASVRGEVRVPHFWR